MVLYACTNTVSKRVQPSRSLLLAWISHLYSEKQNVHILLSNNHSLLFPYLSSPRLFITPLLPGHPYIPLLEFTVEGNGRESR